MDVVMIDKLVRNLGRTYDELLVDGLISDIPLKQSFESNENEELIQVAESGIELWFWEKTKRLERILFSLSKMAEGDSIYTGELPPPFTHKMDRTGVRAMLGEPIESKEPIKIMLNKGFGARDAYRVEASAHPNARVGFQYRNDNTVCTMGFSLIDRGHD